MMVNIETQILKWFDHFHTHPEVSWNEVNTTNKIAKILDEVGVSYRCFSDVTGLIAEIGEGEEVIAVRADMDALWQEVNGVMQANHSCGHDANISMVLGALHYLKDQPLNKRVRFIFQPAEEKGNGALAMIERGAMDQVNYLFGIHLRPIEELPFGLVAPSIHHGAGVFLEGKIIGEDAHGARPHQGKNALDVVVGLHQFLKSIYISPFESYSTKLTKIIAGGESLNIIPGVAEFAIDVRAQKNSILNELQERIVHGLSGLKALYGVDIETRWVDYTPGAEVSKEAASIAEKAIRHVVGDVATASAVVTSGSDDFHFYTIKHPNVKATMIGIGADLTPGLHHPNMTFNHKALDIGARVLAETIIRA
ncbi:amidohydrolase [Heyndrickxia oleronia]|jgi:amidohydrolase|uniref:amidohydrolase n=1 Tax=Heyndrickxia oleronia TaxID=38875 RepID=UPI0024303EF2|nr:amidohydrolase [Heyndrickxia oleronia]MCI1591433.1 amidohydrolase [Heyndrickxia oleronia]MCI1612184.1 amidohydrolase [Heyndrickxia oleronia]MCI1745650.1 amidohydrolase [Heyndrickxia oleronia]MCI1762772.1 amidohydrolase [Heyndrickxia oleronia]